MSDLVGLGEVTQIVGSVENIGSQDVAGLLGIPDLGFSDPNFIFNILGKNLPSYLLAMLGISRNLVTLQTTS